MTTITVTPGDETARITSEQIIRHCGLYARDLYELNGNIGPYKIAGVTTIVRWDSDQDAAVFELDGIAFTVPSSALDDIGLVAASAQDQRPVFNDQEGVA